MSYRGVQGKTEEFSTSISQASQVSADIVPEMLAQQRLQIVGLTDRMRNPHGHILRNGLAKRRPPRARWFDDQSEHDDGGAETIHGQDPFRASVFRVVATGATLDVRTLRLISLRPPHVFLVLRTMFNSIKVAAG